MENKLNDMRHSCSHLLAAAILKLYPNTKLGIGPVIENGFYYDFQFENPISEEDLSEIEEEMRKIKGQNLHIKKTEHSIEEAKRLEENQPFKAQLIEDLEKDGKKTVSFYTMGDFSDLCEGGHLDNTKEIGPFKLTSIAGAYWKGSEKNPMLTRIYGTCFPTQKELDEHLALLEEAKKRDHRKIGKDLELFTFSDLVGKGLPLLTHKGATIRRELERFIVDEELKRGYLHVITPPLAKVDLYKVSGHYPYYKDTMYPPMKVDEEELILRPMTCPHHFMLYKSQPHSYRELPIKYAELASQFRYEKSGELTGLMRVRMFTLSDAHIFARLEQAKKVIEEVLDLIDYVNKVLGLEKGKDYKYRLSLGDRNNEKKYYKDDAAWNKAESILREVLKETNAQYFYEAANEAAFYGPKIDVQVKNVIGKEETAFTVQYDFVLPKRFKLTYTDENGKEQEPVVVHRSSLGAFERIMAFLIEKYKGAFPLWLSPIQAVVIPISEKNLNFAQKVDKMLKNAGIRSQIDDRDERMQAKIREATLQKVPYLCIIGNKEQEDSEKDNAQYVCLRKRSSEDLGRTEVSSLINKLKEEIE